jgi:hypothetical protein
MAKTAQEKPDRRKASPKRKGAPSVGDDVIARRAFEFYCARGGEHGRDLEDWLQAERELRSPTPGDAAAA